MNPKNIFIAVIKNLIVLVIATLIFSSITMNFSNLMEGFFGDIFQYSSPEVQNQVITKLTEPCSSLNQGNAVTLSQLCTNKSLLDSMKQDCKSYRELQSKGIKVDNEAKVMETCIKLESGEIDETCNNLKQKQPLPDFKKIGLLCKDYRDGKIDNREFFYGVVSSPFSGQQFENQQFGLLAKYNNLISYLNNNKILYFIVMTALLALLYLLIMDIRLFLFALSEILFSIGILIVLPYAAILAYDKFIGIDTTSILGSILGLSGKFDFKVVLSVILLLFLRTYNNFIIVVGIILVAIGTIGKIYIFINRKKTLQEEKKENIDDLFKELEQETKIKKK